MPFLYRDERGDCHRAIFNKDGLDEKEAEARREDAIWERDPKQTNAPLSKLKLKHSMVAYFLIIHALFLFSMVHTFPTKIAKEPLTFVFGFAITGGVHRLFSHRSYKAHFLLKSFFVASQSLTLQSSIIKWSKDHRLHHKTSDTARDPHNVNRGLFYSHIGWMMYETPEEVKLAKMSIDVSDLENDKLLKHQDDHYLFYALFFAVFLPIFIPWFYLGSSFYCSFMLCFIFRLVFVYHGTWLINSLAHYKGMKPFNATIKPVENKYIALLTYGESYHNYHHTFPHDYKASELGTSMNPTTFLLDFLAKFGLVYDRISIPIATVNAIALKQGDGSHKKQTGH